MATQNSVNTQFTVGAAGQLTLPAQPAFFAYLNASLTDVTGDVTPYEVIFDATSVNVGSCYNTGTGTFTAPVTGNYFLSSSVLLNNLTSSFTSGNIILSVSGGSPAYNGTYIDAGVCNTSGFLALQISGVFPLTASQTVVVQVTVAGGTKTVGILGLSGTTFSWFSGYLLG